MGKIVCFGEIMLRLATPEYLRFSQASSFEVVYGGGEANVAVSLANYNLQSDFITALPENDLADSAIAHLKSLDVGTQNIIRRGERMGIYFLETGAVNRASKVIYDRSNSSFATTGAEHYNWEKIFENCEWFHWTGITPAISKETAAACLFAVKAAHERGITISCDLNYRAKLWNWGGDVKKVMEELVQYCDIVLGNEEDAEKIFGIQSETTDVTAGKVNADEYKQVCEQLMQKFPKVKKVIITLRSSINANHNEWSGVLFNGKKMIQSPNYSITHIVDRVGGGDSFMGGLIFGLLHYNDDQKALDFATAASCLKHTIKGDFNRVTVKEVENLMDGNRSGRVNR
jgi:2-dehydro-3-deoxygluconokinase